MFPKYWAGPPSLALADSQEEENRPQDQVLALVVQIWEQGKDRIVARIDTLEQATLALLDGRLETELRREAEREAHKLAGSLTTFGFPQGSRLARDIEQTFQADSPLESKDALRLSEKVVSLRQALEREPVQPASQPSNPPPSTGSRLLVIDDDREVGDRLTADAPGRGLETEFTSSLTAAREAISRHRPAVVFLNLSAPKAKAEHLVFIEELSGGNPPIPVLVRTRRDATLDRVQVAQAGGRGFLPDSLPPPQLLDAVCGILGQTGGLPAKVLAVDDDPQILDLLKGFLDPVGARFIGVSHPLEFWNALEENAPDLVVLDVDMPEASGIELCWAIRSDPRWSGLPVVFLTSKKDPEIVHQLFLAGADDYVAKPLVGDEMVIRVLNRLERTRLLRSGGETDALTGLGNRQQSTRNLDQLLGLAQLHSQAFCLGVVDVDSLAEINQRHGHPAGDKVLRRLAQILHGVFRSEDVMGRWDGAQFVVGMYGMTKEDGLERLSQLLESMHREVFTDAGGIQYQVSCSAGVAGCPANGMDLPALSQSAHQALRQAKSHGPNQVLPAGWLPGQEALARKVDVLLVDDDETLASLLLHALENRGYATRWLQDGLEAVEALGGANPPLRASLVLLDVDIPGLDGIGVLRQLAREGIVGQTRVIMVTRRTSEEEVLTCLELGAFDHISKPFSVPVLLQRIKGALKLAKGDV